MKMSPPWGAVLLAMVVAPVAAESDSPMAKVVTLLQDLKAKIEADGQAEQKIYDKFACWCEKTTARKASAIETAKTSIEELSSKVLELKSKTASFAADVAQLQKEIAENEDGQRQATSIRDRETKDYEGQRESLEQAIGSLEHAIGVLTGAGEFTQKDSRSLGQEADLISVSRSLRSVLHQASKFDEGSDQDRELISEFIRDPSAFFGPKAAFLQTHSMGFGGDYAAGSGQIQGVLKGMYDAMVSDLEAADGEQGRKQKEYEELIATKQDALATLKKSEESKRTTLGTDKKAMADASLERDETKTALDADEAFFLDAKDQCQKKAAEWAERTRLRSEEKAGVLKAIEILSGGEETFSKATSMFLQTRHASGEKPKVLRELRRLATTHQSIRLAKVGSLLQTATKADFPVVMEAVDKMLTELRAEEQDDITLRDYCQAEEVKVETEMEDLDHKMEDLSGLIDRLKAEKKQLQEEQTQTESDIAATEEAMAEALSQRNEESSAFKAALADDVEAIELLTQAKEALSGGKPAASLAQTSRHGLKLKRDPEYNTEDKPPDTFKEPYGGRPEANGIEQLLDYLKEDLENEVLLAKDAEAKAQKEFETQRLASTKVLQALQAKFAELQAQEAATDEQIAENEASKESAGKMKESKGEYRESLKPKCDWMKEAFEKRRDARQDEMTGLLRAKASIAGAGQ